MSVKQSIKVTNAGLSPILSVAQGTGAIEYEFTVSDFDIPSGSAAVAYNIQPTGNIVSQTCSISGNTITVKPPAYYFLRGKNYMQFQVSKSNEDLFSFLIEVWCAPNISQPEVIVAENPSLVSQLISDVGLLSSQLDNLLSIPSGSLSTSADAALADIKVGWDGTTYDTPGDAVRGQIGSLSEDISDITDTEKSINLFNVETIDVQMRLYSDTGKLQPQKNSGWISSDFIEIDSSRQYLITQQTVEYGRTTINITGRLCFYSSKSENGFISGLSNASTTFTNSVLRNAIPENTKYIKISLSLSNSEPASLELAKKCEIMIFEIPSDSTESIIPTPYVAFFEKKVVKTDKTLSKSNIPADAEVVGDKIEKLSDVIYNNKEEVDNKISNLIVTKTGYNLLNHVEKGKILNPTTGIVTDYAHFSTSDFIEITEGKGYVITQYYDNGINQRKNSAASRVCWYDTNKMYIGGSENVKAEYDTNVPITFPQNAKYIRVCFATTDLETMKYMLLEVYGTVYNTLYLPYLPYGYSENIPTKPKASFEEYRYLCFSFLNTVNQLNILGSDNLINFAPIKMSTFIASKLFTASKTKGGEKGVFASSVRDPAVIKYKEWYYIVYTVGSFYYDYNVIGMCRTKDFVDYEELDLIEVHCDFDTIRLWAPCWFRDIDEKTYITVSADDNGVFKTVIAEYNFDENTLGAGTVIIDDGGIDYHIFRHKGYYYAFGGNNKIRKSNTLLSLWGNNTIINTALPIGYEAHYPVVLDDGSLRLFRQELETNFEHAYMTYSDQTFDDIDNGKCGEVLYCRFNGNLQSEGEPIHMHWTIYDRFCRNGNNNNYIN